MWRIGVDVLAGARFAISPLVETVAALTVLAGAEPGPALREWARTYRPPYRELIAADPVAGALVAAALRPGWIAHMLAVPPRPGDSSFEEELRRIRELDPVVARRTLADGGRLSARLRRADIGATAAELLDWVWTTVRQDWQRRRRLLEVDIAFRTRRLAAGGWASAADGMRRDMRWLGHGELRVNSYDYPPRAISEAELMFVPSSSRRGWLAWEEPHRYAIVYPCRGLLVPPVDEPTPHVLTKLIGPRRASVLGLLAEPRTTSELCALTGYGLGSVGDHLKVLLNARLMEKRRNGRLVLYHCTPLGHQLTRREAETPAS